MQKERRHSRGAAVGTVVMNSIKTSASKAMEIAKDGAKHC
jgi:hypothetical protein